MVSVSSPLLNARHRAEINTKEDSADVPGAELVGIVTWRLGEMLSLYLRMGKPSRSILLSAFISLVLRVLNLNWITSTQLIAYYAVYNLYCVLFFLEVVCKTF